MTQAVTDLLVQARALTESERAALVHELRKTLPRVDADEELLSPEELDELWAEELDRREKELADGTVQAIPAFEALEQIRKKLS